MSTFLLRSSSLCFRKPKSSFLRHPDLGIGNSAFKLPNSNRFVSHIRNCETLYYEITELLNTRREMSGNEFRFFLSCDINLPLTFRIERLEGTLNRPKSTSSGTFSISIFRSVRFGSIFRLISILDFNFLYSADVDPTPTTEERRAELYVECALYIDGAPFGLPTRTRF